MLEEEEYELNCFDVANGLPLIYAWALSSTNNNLRKFYRNMLMKWALLVPYEFYKLFIKFASVNDPQIRADIFSILMCVVFESNEIKLTEDAYKWIIENILSKEKVELNRDIAVRYYSIAIIKKAVQLKIVKLKELKHYLPPYSPKNNYITLSKDAIIGTRMGGYGAIDYDLSRYVLVDHFERCFSSDREVKHDKLKNLLDNIIFEQNEYIGMSFENFMISAAYAYILKCGWNEKDFYFYNEKKCGVDNAIANIYSPATHGSQSLVMTFCEKYIWQFRNYISGYLADRKLLYDDYDRIVIDDYSLIDDFIIPAQELNQIDPDNISLDQPWHIPEKEIVYPENECNSKDDIIRYIYKSSEIDWQKWLSIDNQSGKYKVNSDRLLALSGYSCFYSPVGIMTCLFINSILISEKELEPFVSMVQANKKLSERISNPVDWRGGIKTSCYITPKEVCWFDWKKRYDSDLKYEFTDLTIYSAVDECCYNYHNYGDVYYNLPSKPVRGLLKICNSDGYLFYDANKNVKAIFSITGEKRNTYQQYLLVNEKELLQSLKENGKTLIWIMREDMRERMKATERFGEFYVNKDYSYVGYFKDNNFQTFKISSILKSK